jgi:hypothetical protein
MNNNFVSIDDLLKNKSKEELDFYSKIVERDKNEDGTSNGVLRRMLNSDICKRCHSEYKVKYPNRPFNITCEGIVEEPEIELLHAKFNEIEVAAGEPLTSLESVRQSKNSSAWATAHLVAKASNGDPVPLALRWYQGEMVRCTAKYKVSRICRGGGKTLAAVAEELWYVMNNKNKYVMVVYPSEAMSTVFFNELIFQKENSTTIRKAWKGQRQKPFYEVRFKNGSMIRIFTAGSASGKGANILRSQSPDRIRLDEQDYLSEEDYNAINPLLTRFEHSSGHGASTPTGDRSEFWRWCKQRDDFKEFFFPITVHPLWSTEYEAECKRNAKTADRYRHEYLAEFSDPAAGVFKKKFVEDASQPYKYSQCTYDATKKYFMGVDWNGRGTGTRIRIVEYNPLTKVRKAVAAKSVDSENTRTIDSINVIIDLNKRWHCEEVYIDAGFGAAQDELIRQVGVSQAYDADTRRLKFIKTVDFGGKLSFNKLVPNREDGKRTPGDDNQLERRTKPFMVEGAVMAFEMGLVEFSSSDDLLEEQLMGYRINTWTKGDQANTYTTEADSGDHDLDAFMLALLGIELKYGIFHTPDTLKRIASVSFSPGFGMPSVPKDSAIPQDVNMSDLKKQRAGVQSRTTGMTRAESIQSKLSYLTQNKGALSSTIGGGKGVPSRTNLFGEKRPSRGGLR